MSEAIDRQAIHSVNRRVALIGGGVIGGGWAARFALNGWQVKVYDPAENASELIDAVLQNARRSMPMLYECELPKAGDVRLCRSLAEAVDDVDWVQESIPENLPLKRSVRDEIESRVAADLPIASSTSGFRPSELSQGARHPERILVAHPFNPVYLLPLVELVGSDEAQLARASWIFESIGMYPLVLARENDAHIADRLLEAVWREALWLVKDGYASTAEIDDAIRYGFGLRWAQMGLFETYRIAGGEGGMAHFLRQFGPCLAWPWTKLTDVPVLDEELIQRIARQSDQQAGELSIRELERLRDDHLVAILRALKQQNSAAGSLLRRHEQTLHNVVDSAFESAATSSVESDSLDVPSEGIASLRNSADRPPLLITVSRTVPVDWTDYNGHMNEGRYGQVFSDAADAVLAFIGCGTDYVAGGLSWFTVETSIRYRQETLAAEGIRVYTRVKLAEGRKLKLQHEMQRRDNGAALADCDQFLLHVSLESRRSCEPGESVQQALQALLDAQRESG